MLDYYGYYSKQSEISDRSKGKRVAPRRVRRRVIVKRRGRTEPLQIYLVCNSNNAACNGSFASELFVSSYRYITHILPRRTHGKRNVHDVRQRTPFSTANLSQRFRNYSRLFLPAMYSYDDGRAEKRAPRARSAVRLARRLVGSAGESTLETARRGRHRFPLSTVIPWYHTLTGTT